MGRGFLVTGWAMALALVATAPAGAACWQPEEYEAARIRDLQTMLMVSALQCRTRDPEMPAAYNKFVQRAKPTLLEGEKALLGHFAREGDKLAYDRFTTSLANRYADLAQHPEFCTRAKRILAADEATGGALPTVVVLLNARPAGVEEVCTTQRKSSVIVVSPFDPLPEAAVKAPAPTVATAAPPTAAPPTAVASTASTPTAAPAAAAGSTAPATASTASGPSSPTP